MTYEEKIAAINAIPDPGRRFLESWKFQREILDMSVSGKLWVVTPDKKPEEKKT